MYRDKLQRVNIRSSMTTSSSRMEDGATMSRKTLMNKYMTPDSYKNKYIGKRNDNNKHLKNLKSVIDTNFEDHYYKKGLLASKDKDLPTSTDIDTTRANLKWLREEYSFKSPDKDLESNEINLYSLGTKFTIAAGATAYLERKTGFISKLKSRVYNTVNRLKNKELPRETETILKTYKFDPNKDRFSHTTIADSSYKDISRGYRPYSENHLTSTLIKENTTTIDVMGYRYKEISKPYRASPYLASSSRSLYNHLTQRREIGVTPNTPQDVTKPHPYSANSSSIRAISHTNPAIDIAYETIESNSTNRFEPITSHRNLNPIMDETIWDKPILEEVQRVKQYRQNLSLPTISNTYSPRAFLPSATPIESQYSIWDRPFKIRGLYKSSIISNLPLIHSKNTTHGLLPSSITLKSDYSIWDSPPELMAYMSREVQYSSTKSQHLLPGYTYDTKALPSTRHKLRSRSRADYSIWDKPYPKGRPLKRKIDSSDYSAWSDTTNVYPRSASIPSSRVLVSSIDLKPRVTYEHIIKEDLRYIPATPVSPSFEERIWLNQRAREIEQLVPKVTNQLVLPPVGRTTYGRTSIKSKANIRTTSSALKHSPNIDIEPSSNQLLLPPAKTGGIIQGEVSTKKPIAGPLGKALLGIAGLGTIIGGPTFLSNLFTSTSSFFRDIAIGNKYSNVYDEKGLPAFPTKGKPIAGFTRRDTYIEGLPITDPTAATYTPYEGGMNIGLIRDLGIGAITGIGAMGGLDLASKSLINKGGVVGEAFEKTFESNFRKTGELAFGRNFAPALIGGIVGGALESRDGEGNVIASAVTGSMIGSFVGFISMKEEMGPAFNKTLGIGLIGAVAAMTLLSRESSEAEVYNKVGSQYNVVYDNTAELIRQGKADIPYDLYANPHAEDIVRAYQNRSSNFKRAKRYVADSESYTTIDRYISRQDIPSELAEDLVIPSYQNLEGYNLQIGFEDLQRDIHSSALESTKKGFLTYQTGYILPMLGAVGAIGFLGSKIGKRFGPNISKMLGITSTYELKQKYIWPGERKIGQSLTPLLQGLIKNDTTQIKAGAKGLMEGISLKARGEVISNAKSLALYTPLLLISGTVINNIFSQSREKSIERYSVNHWDGFSTVFRGSPDPKVNKIMNLQKYLLEGKASRVDKDTLLYDSATIGQGFKDFLINTPDSTLKALLYKTGDNEELLKLLYEKSQREGLGISGGGAVTPSFFDNLVSATQPQKDLLGYALTTPFRVASDKGFAAGIATVTNPLIGSISNSIATTLGIRQPFGTGDVEGTIAANLINTGLFGGVSFIGGGLISKSRKGALIGGVLGGLLGSTLPTDINNYFYKSVAQQGSHLIESPKAYLRHQALTEPNTSTNIVLGLTSSMGIGAIGGTTIGALASKRRSKTAVRAGSIGALVGLGTNIISSLVQGDGPLPNFSSGVGRLFTHGVDMRDKSFSVLTGGRYTKNQYTHLHSKVLWTEAINQEEVFISTGNLETIYTTQPGQEQQFNIGIRIKGDQANKLIGQLNILHDYMKSIRTDSDPQALAEVAEAMPDFILGGKGSQSIEKIKEFLLTSEGDIMISAPYMSYAGKGEVSQLIETIELLESRGQDVTIIGQNPRGIMAGGRPDLSEKLYSRLLDAGVDIINAPEDSDVLAHAKFIADEKRLLLTSHNLFSKNSSRHVIEVGMVLQGEQFAQAAKNAAIRFAINKGFSNLDSRAEREKVDRLGFSPQLYGMFNEQSGNLLIDPKMGASFFYSRALYNNLMRQSGNFHKVLSYKDYGIASSLYKQAMTAQINAKRIKNGLDPTSINFLEVPDAVRQYDKELLTQGLGGYLNENVFMPLGLGRLYKDEFGFIPSLAGSLGAVLDRTFLFYSGTDVPGLTSYGQEIRDRGYRAKAGREGFFEYSMTELAQLTQASATAVLFYITVGEPLNLIFSESFKHNTEDVIEAGLTSDIRKFRTVSNRLSRLYGIGLNTDYTTPFEARLSVLTAIESEKYAFYDNKRFDLTPYHINAAFLRRRSEILGENIIKPFLLEYVNPYRMDDSLSQYGFIRQVDKFIEEIGKPADLIYEISTSKQQAISGLLSRNAQLEQDLIGKGINPDDLKIKQIIGYTKSRELAIGILRDLGAQDLDTNNLNPILETIQDAISYIESEDETLRLKAVNLVSRLHHMDDISTLNDYSLTKEGELITPSHKSADDIRFRVTNVGQDRASNIARMVQDVIDEIPLNPLNWSLFNKYKWASSLTGNDIGGYKRYTDEDGTVQPRVRTIGNVLSFDVMTHTIRGLLFGKGGIDQFLTKYEVISGKEATYTKRTIDNLHTFWNTTIGFGVETSKKIWKRFVTIHGLWGLKGHYGLLGSTDALKSMEYHLASQFIDDLPGIQWGDDFDAIKEEREKLAIKAEDKWKRYENLIASEEQGSLNKDSMKVLGATEDELAEAKITLSRWNRQDYINHYIAEEMDPHINPIVRRINQVDEVVVNTLQQVHKTQKQMFSSLDVGEMLMDMQEYLRAEEMGAFRTATLGPKALKRRLGKQEPGWGLDATSRITKMKGLNVALSVLAIGSLFADNLFKNTSGVSLLTQLRYALHMGDSPLSSNKQGELAVNTKFDADRWGVGLHTLFGVFGMDVSDTGTMGRVASTIGTSAISLGLSYIIGSASLQPQPIELGFKIKDIAQSMGDPNKQSKAISLYVQGIEEGLTTEQIYDRLKSTRGKINLGFLMQNANPFSLEATIQGEMAKVRTIRFKGNLWRNTAIAYSVLSIGSQVALSSISGLLNSTRDMFDGSLDPIAGAFMGSVLFGASTKKFGWGLAGAAIGGLAGYFTSNILDKSILSIGRNGMLVDNINTQIISEVSDFRSNVMANVDRASRVEMMAALWSRSLDSMFDIAQEQPYGRKVEVIAKQATMPVLQFFFASKTMGRREFNGETINSGTTYYYAGIQGPPILGVSTNISLPFKLMSKGGFSVFGKETGIALNEEYDLFDLLKGVGDISAGLQIAGGSFVAMGSILQAMTSVTNYGYRKVSKIFGHTVNPQGKIATDNSLKVIGRSFSASGNAVSDMASMFSSTVTNVTTSMFSVDYRLAYEVMPAMSNIGKPKVNKPQSLGKVSTLKTFGSVMGKSLGASIIGSLIGGFAGAINSTPNDDFRQNVKEGVNIGGYAGLAAGVTYQLVGAYLLSNEAKTKLLEKGDQYLRPINNVFTSSNNNIRQIARNSEISSIPSILRKSTPYIGAFSAAYLMTDSGFGVTQGMDQDVISRMTSVALYTVAMKTIAKRVGLIGLDTHSTIERYTHKLDHIDTLRNTTQASNMIPNTSNKFKEYKDSIRLKINELSIRGIEKDTDVIFKALQRSRRDIEKAYENLVRVKGEDFAIRSKIGTLRELSSLIENSGHKSTRAILADRNVKDKFLDLVSKGRGSFIDKRVTPRLFTNRLIRGPIGTLIAAQVIGSTLHAVAPQAFNANNFYKQVEGTRTGVIDSILSILPNNVRDGIGDAVRLLTFSDRDVRTKYSLDAVIRSGQQWGDWRNNVVSRPKMLIGGTDYGTGVNQTLSEISDLLIIDKVNTFLSVPGIGGGTIRESDKGSMLTPYVQLQGPGADISAASYKMVSRFLFRSVLYGQNEFYMRLAGAMRDRNIAIEQGVVDKSTSMRSTALKLLSVTASLQPRRSPRRITRPSSETLSAITLDSLASSILQHRVDMSKNMSYQPPESLVTRMWIQSMSTNHRYLDSMLKNALSSEGDFNMKAMVDMLMKDPFYNVSRTFNIINVKFFGGDTSGNGAKPSYTNTNANRDIWTDYNSPYLELFQSEPTNLLETDIVNNAKRMFDLLPGPLGNIAMFGSIAALGLMTFTSLIAKSEITEASQMGKSIKEFYSRDWFPKGDTPNSYAWKVRPHPLIGTGLPLKAGGELLPIIHKGNYVFEINKNISFDRTTKAGYLWNKSVLESFNRAQEELSNLFKKGFNETNIVLWFNSQQKTKQLQQILTEESYQFIRNKETRKFVNPKQSIEANLKRLSTAEQKLNDKLNQLHEQGIKSSDTRIKSIEASKKTITSLKVNMERHITMGPQVVIHKALTEAYMEDIDTFINSYYDVLEKNTISVSRDMVESLPGFNNMDSVKQKALIDRFFSKSNRIEVSLMAIFAPDASLEEFLSIRTADDMLSILDETQKAAFTYQDSTDQLRESIRGAMRRTAKKQVEEIIQSEVLGPAYRKSNFLRSGATGSIAEQIALLNERVLGRIAGIGETGKNTFMSSLIHHWGNLGRTPNADTNRILQATNRVAVRIFKGIGDIIHPEHEGTLESTRAVRTYMVGDNPRINQREADVTLDRLSRFTGEGVSKGNWDDFRTRFKAQLNINPHKIPTNFDLSTPPKIDIYRPYNTPFINPLGETIPDYYSIEIAPKPILKDWATKRYEHVSKRAQDLVEHIDKLDELEYDLSKYENTGRRVDRVKSLLEKKRRQAQQELNKLGLDAYVSQQGDMMDESRQISLLIENPDHQESSRFVGTSLREGYIYTNPINGKTTTVIPELVVSSHKGKIKNQPTDTVRNIGLGVDEELEAQRRATLDAHRNRIGSMSGTDRITKAGTAGWEGLSFVGDILETVNVFGALSRVSKAYGNENITAAQRQVNINEAGTILASTVMGLASLGVLQGIQAGAIALAGAISAPLWAVLGIGAVATTILGVTGYALLGEKGRQKVGQKWGEFWKGTTEFMSNTVKTIGDKALDIGGKRLASATTMGLGGAVAGLTLGLGIATTSLFVAGTALTLGLVGSFAAVGLGLGLAGGALLGMLAPEGTSNLFTSMISSLSKVTIGKFPLFGMFLNNEGDWLRMQNFQAPVSGISKYGSPLYVGTVNEVIQSDYSRMLYAAKDTEGISSANQFVGSIISNSSIDNPFLKKYGNVSHIKPTSLNDPLINREMKVRGQYFNQTIVGRITWQEILRNSQNERQIRDAIKAYKAEDSKVKEARKVSKEALNSMVTPKAKSNGINTSVADSVSNILATAKEISQMEYKSKQGYKAYINKDEVESKSKEAELLAEQGKNSKYKTIKKNNNDGSTIELSKTDDSDIVSYAQEPIATSSS